MKVYGILKDYIPVRQDISRYVISYGIEQVDETHYTWYEVVFYKKKNPLPTYEQIHEAICADINTQTDEKILSGFVWNNNPVWLSTENQFNYKAAYDLAVQTGGATLPIKFKLGEDAEGNPIYYTFTDVATLGDFYIKAMQYIQGCLAEGWERKDAIDWEKYKPVYEE